MTVSPLWRIPHDRFRTIVTTMSATHEHAAKAGSIVVIRGTATSSTASTIHARCASCGESFSIARNN